MSDVDIMVTLPGELVERAENEGIAINKRIAVLLQEEIERVERWHALDQSLEPVRESFRQEYGHLSEDEVMDMINEWIDEAHAEYEAQAKKTITGKNED